MLDRASIVQFFTDIGLGRVAERMVDLVVPCVRLEADSDAMDSGQAGSRAGGVPDVPAEFVWPADNGTPMIFLGQFDLGGMDGIDDDDEIPEKFRVDGLLSFFASPNTGPELVPNKNACRVFLFDHASLAGSNRLDPESDTILVLQPDQIIESTGSMRMKRVGMNEEEAGILDELDSSADDGTPRHHLFGSPMSCNESSETAFHVLMDQLDQQGMVPLFQCDSDPAWGWQWGEFGRAHFFIHQDDLKAGRFERVSLVWQEGDTPRIAVSDEDDEMEFEGLDFEDLDDSETDGEYPCFAEVIIPGELSPMDRGEKFEDPLEEFLQDNELGSVSGGGTMLDDDGKPEYACIDLELADLDSTLNLVVGKLRELGAPRGTKISIGESDETRDVWKD